MSYSDPLFLAQIGADLALIASVVVVFVYSRRTYQAAVYTDYYKEVDNLYNNILAHPEYNHIISGLAKDNKDAQERALALQTLITFYHIYALKKNAIFLRMRSGRESKMDGIYL